MKILFFLLCIFCTTISYAQRPFEGEFRNKDMKIYMEINLYEKNAPLSDFEDESCYGSLYGFLNGSWMIMKVEEIDEDKAIVRAISDSGIEAQSLELKITEEGISIKQLKTKNIRGVNKDHKYYNLPKVFSLKKYK